ncbi:rRNA-processing protein [Saccharomycopsis crataegensis]|uniref:rRNA biogenesis protein RRP36 n=1 Tax=Saccharomycopsis crataegensis TaxID=43959 RepID=A0AAV5QHZ5_9ASCO|nr:rRNA-processing protein [Saccharomycopsis crataegensis]
MGQPERKKKNKHAPSEASCKEPQPKIRSIQGLDTSKYKESKYGDIRFDPAFGKANDIEVRKNYQFLDKYRHEEIKKISGILKDPKSAKILKYGELEDLDYQMKSLKSRMDSLKNKDLAMSVKRRVKNQYFDEIKQGKKGHYLKRADQQKLIQVEKFKHMKKRQVDKVIERKRKKTLAKEYKNVEFLKNDR